MFNIEHSTSPSGGGHCKSKQYPSSTPNQSHSKKVQELAQFKVKASSKSNSVGHNFNWPIDKTTKVNKSTTIVTDYRKSGKFSQNNVVNYDQLDAIPLKNTEKSVSDLRVQKSEDFLENDSQRYHSSNAFESSSEGCETLLTAQTKIGLKDINSILGDQSKSYFKLNILQRNLEFLHTSQLIRGTEAVQDLSGQQNQADISVIQHTSMGPLYARNSAPTTTVALSSTTSMVASKQASNLNENVANIDAVGEMKSPTIKSSPILSPISPRRLQILSEPQNMLNKSDCLVHKTNHPESQNLNSTTFTTSDSCSRAEGISPALTSNPGPSTIASYQSLSPTSSTSSSIALVSLPIYGHYEVNMINCKTGPCPETTSESLSRVSLSCPPTRPELPDQNFRHHVNNYEMAAENIDSKPQQPTVPSYAQSDTSEELNVDGNDEDNSNDSSHGLSLVGTVTR